MSQQSIHCRFRATLCVALLVSAAQAAHATELSRNAPLAVRVVVLPRAQLRLDYQRPTLDVSAADLARGYVAVAGATRLRVTTNSAVGYAIEILPRLPIFKSVTVRTGDGRGGKVDADGGTLVTRSSACRDRPVVLDYRFELTATVLPGTYDWPLALQVRPL